MRLACGPPRAGISNIDDKQSMLVSTYLQYSSACLFGRVFKAKMWKTTELNATLSMDCNYKKWLPHHPEHGLNIENVRSDCTAGDAKRASRVIHFVPILPVSQKTCSGRCLTFFATPQTPQHSAPLKGIEIFYVKNTFSKATYRHEAIVLTLVSQTESKSLCLMLLER